MLSMLRVLRQNKLMWLMIGIGVGIMHERCELAAIPLTLHAGFCDICLTSCLLTPIGCGHAYCCDCLKQLIKAAPRTQTSSYVRCPHLDCRAPITHEEMVMIADNHQEVCPLQELTSAPEQMQVQAHVQHCSLVLWFKRKIRERVEKRRLKKLHRQHIKENCTWIMSNTRPCPQCSVPIQKNGGCNIMHCTRCRTNFFWLEDGCVLA